jgi:hypothetical protein
VGVKAGVNRFLWDLRHEGATRVLGNKMAGEANKGPLVVPGTYEVRLTIDTGSGSEVLSQTFEVQNDPRAGVSQGDLERQLDALLQVRDKISDAHGAINSLRGVRSQLEGWVARSDLAADARSAAETVTEKLAEVETELIKPGEHKDMFGLHERARLNEKMASLISILNSADAPPTKQALELAAKYGGEIDAQVARLDEVLRTDLERFNALMTEADIPAVEVKT